MSRCPICRTTVEPPASGASVGLVPFCSDRCKLIDLGRWLSDAYQIPSDPADDGDGEVDLDVWVDPNPRNNRR